MKIYLATSASSEREQTAIIAERLQKAFPNCYEITGQGAWVIGVPLGDTIGATAAGISSVISNGSSGSAQLPHVVVEVDGYYGYHANGLWNKIDEWRRSA